MKTLLLIDAHAMIHRAYHALPDTLATRDGTPTGAIYGFFLMMQKVLLDFRPTHLAVCFDTPKPTFRKKLFDGYQAKRPPMEDALKVQIPKIKELLDKGGVTRLEKPGFEADDIIGTISEKQKSDFDRVLILTGDRDLLQLTDDKVFLIAPKRGVTNFDLFTPHEVKMKFGVTPEHIPDYKALAGDSSDNYNTVRGIGPKTAQKLLKIEPTVEKLLEHLDLVDNEKWRTILSEHKEQILLFKKIATIVRDVEVNPPKSQLAFSGFRDDMKAELKKLELFSLVTKLYENIELQPVKKEEKKKKENNSDQIDLFS
ncbi:hypothetical protein IPM65_06875 [Candidatus Roizmanbacteria bacterium]|nr:MAG: hypothetical protein IPM65_06875 [Candidatus Roizmanbacteria bacterium]